ncbi:MAG: copper ABC transporter, partial [Bacteroidetes bacterium]|nr:copper ABC transporter [Bacteroidota bacterium]
MKKSLKSIEAIIAILLVTSLFFACSDGQKKPAVTQVKPAVKYTCPMHPQVLEDHPGTCPICGMTLVKKTGQASEEAGISLTTVLKPVNASVVSSVPAITPKQKTIAATISANGYLDFDT